MRPPREVPHGRVLPLLSWCIVIFLLLASLVVAPCERSFKFAFTDLGKDLDASRSMEMFGQVEGGISKIFYQIFKAGCVKPDGSRSLFADMGANFGWFLLLAAAMGCRHTLGTCGEVSTSWSAGCLRFEPVSHIRAFIEYSIDLNNLSGSVDVRSEVVGHLQGHTLEVVVPSAGIWGTAGIEGLNIDSSIPGDTERLQVPSVMLGSEVEEDVLLLKVRHRCAGTNPAGSAACRRLRSRGGGCIAACWGRAAVFQLQTSAPCVIAVAAVAAP
ncbi:hypothetical protein FOA52_002929 [Chlamydomonas sp. UWO 241]|nr:hypothetical protein FOA52_002929 [Chlamydomonas sp. UWO 241]